MLREEQIDIRRKRAAAEQFKIQNLGRNRVFSDYQVANPTTGGQLPAGGRVGHLVVAEDAVAAQVLDLELLRGRPLAPDVDLLFAEHRAALRSPLTATPGGRADITPLPG